MDSDDELELLLIASLYLVHKRKRRRRKSVWVRPIFRKRRQHGEYHQLLQEMRLSDPESHFRYLRMSVERFDMLLAKVRILICWNWQAMTILPSWKEVGPALSHRQYYSSTRAEITPGERLALTLRYLATGSSQVYTQSFTCAQNIVTILRSHIYRYLSPSTLELENLLFVVS